ncbi:MAG: hypothetical protein JWM32_985 [Verrucomicrobia bacterium]|nr:hypothetical protein [Verrucomicrobiota bacterium]
MASVTSIPTQRLSPTVKSPKNVIIVVLALTIAGGGAMAWQQYQELVKLRAAAMNNDERANWQKKLWDAEKRRHELEASLAALQAKAPESTDGAGEEGSGAAGGPGGGRRRGPGGNMSNNFMAMMDRPEIQKLLAIQQRGVLDSHYAALFKSLNLSPDQLEKFKSLLVEKQTAIADVLSAARAQGIDPRSDPQEFRKLVADTQADVDANIKATLGDAGFAQYQQYQQTLPQRNVVTQLEQSLSYTNTPLTPAQSEQLVQVLASTSPASSNSANNRATIAANFGVGFGGTGPTSPITDAAIQQASGVLAPAQVQALQQLQQAQLAQQQLTQAMRNQFGGQARTTMPVTPAAPVTKPGG